MIKAAIDRVLQLADPHIEHINGRVYSDKPMHSIDSELRATGIKMSSLSSLVNYIKSGLDRKESAYLVHVLSPTEVSLVSCLDGDRQREILVDIRAEVPEFSFNREIPHENFIIGVQSKFISSTDNDKALILKFAGTVTTGSVTEYGDDGITQKATIKNGVASMAEAIVPSPCRLRPYRTFIEVEQPESDFIFRLSEKAGDIYCALYEADGGAWKVEAKRNIYEYLNEQLKDCTDVLVIA